MNNNNERFKEILEHLKQQFDGRLLLSVNEAGQVFGVKPQTIYNRIAKNAKNPFPIEVIRMGGPKFRLYDIAKFLAR